MIRPRRLRRILPLRDLVHEVDVCLSHLIQPYFLAAGKNERTPITGFTEVYRMGIDPLSRQMENDLERGLSTFLLFGSDALKDVFGSRAHAEDGMVPATIRKLKERFGEHAFLISDVCLCPYTSSGHCGILTETSKGSEIANEDSVKELCKQALCHVQAGIDWVAPSDMMDGRVSEIRHALDSKGYRGVGILAYTAKYCSSYYGPFREALANSPQKMDRATYQMDYRNSREAIRELELDLAEGADMVMVKPALAYLDIIALFRSRSTVPVAAYSVSGEYEMVKRLAACGMTDERKMTVENLTSIFRAGAQVVITYSASEIAEKGWLLSK